MEITLTAVIEAARRRRAGVTAEVAGYLVLLAVQQVALAPRRVQTDALLLNEAGELRVSDGARGSEAEIEAELRQLLATLTALAQSVAPALRVACERGAAGDLRALEGELMAALIPINHAASRRALARLYREAHKAQLSPAIAAESRATAATPSPAPVSVARQSSADPSLRTPAPPSAGRVVETPLAPSARVLPELEIEVDVVGVEQPVRHAFTPAPLTPAPRAVEPAHSSPLPPAVNAALEEVSSDEPPAHRSDLRELLAGFLAHTRSEEQMTANLRKMIGIEAPPLPRPSSAPPLFAAPDQAR